MGLPAGEQRVLDTIENQLRITDQQPEAAFVAFARFVSGARMPVPERLSLEGPARAPATPAALTRKPTGKTALPPAANTG